MTFPPSSTAAKDARYRKNNSRHWCEYCRTYVYNNNICLTRHESSPQHKAAVARYVERMQREERETEQVLKSVQARTGLTFPKAGPQAAGGEDAKGTSFYSQSEGGHGAATSKGVASKPIHLLSMQTGAGVKKASRSNGASGNPGAAVLGAMVPRAVAKQQQQQYQPKAAIPINVEAIGRETSDPAGTVQETTIGSGLMNREGSERMTTTNGGEDVLDLVADKEGRSLQKESLSLSSPAGDTKDDDREDECKHRNRDHGGGDGEKEIVLRRFDKPKHLRQ